MPNHSETHHTTESNSTCDSKTDNHSTEDDGAGTSYARKTEVVNRETVKLDEETLASAPCKPISSISPSSEDEGDDWDFTDLDEGQLHPSSSNGGPETPLYLAQQSAKAYQEFSDSTMHEKLQAIRMLGGAVTVAGGAVTICSAVAAAAAATSAPAVVLGVAGASLVATGMDTMVRGQRSAKSDNAEDD